MIKNSILSLAVTFLLVGCGSSNSDSGSSVDNHGIELWSYFAPTSSISQTFDEITSVNDIVTSTKIGLFSHDYTVISDNEVKGSWRTFEGQYSIKKQDGLMTFTILDGQAASSSVSGGFHDNSSINSSLFLDGTGIGDYSQTVGGVSSSYSSEPGECILNNLYDSITLFENYTYDDVIELRCERTISQFYSDDVSSKTLDAPQISYEYYQKNVGWIAKVDKDCIVTIKDNYNFIDDTSDSCLKTTVKYQLLAN